MVLVVTRHAPFIYKKFVRGDRIHLISTKTNITCLLEIISRIAASFTTWGLLSARNAFSEVNISRLDSLGQNSTFHYINMTNNKLYQKSERYVKCFPIYSMFWNLLSFAKSFLFFPNESMEHFRLRRGKFLLLPNYL